MQTLLPFLGDFLKRRSLLPSSRDDVEIPEAGEEVLSDDTTNRGPEERSELTMKTDNHNLP